MHHAVICGRLVHEDLRFAELVCCVVGRAQLTYDDSNTDASRMDEVLDPQHFPLLNEEKQGPENTAKTGPIVAVLYIPEACLRPSETSYSGAPSWAYLAVSAPSL